MEDGLSLIPPRLFDAAMFSCRSLVAGCIALVLLLCASPALAQDYGETDFANSGDAAAQEAFTEGLLMLHSFEYPEAREAFEQALNADPDFAMAVWGVAMTHNHPIWMEQDREAALKALQTLGDTPDAQLAAAPTQRERDYLRTVHVLYGAGETSPASKQDRDDAYAEAMAELAATYPGDLDAQAFHALSILGTAHEGRDFATYMRAAAVAEEVFDANPKHPGAAHYLIHAYDDPVHAPLGLRPARIYADIAPKASHALHMPSHIFFALGMWDRGAASNVDSYEAERDQAEAAGDPLGGGGYHALHWLAYARAQQGRYDDARRVTELGAELALASEGVTTGYERYMLSAFLASYVVETKRWDEMPEMPIDTTGLSPRLKTAVRATQGIAALKTGDRAAAERHLEDDMPLDFGPAWPLKPAHELYGEVLLDLDRPAESQAQFEASLKRYPRRALSLWGRARAAALAGNAQAAQEARSALREVWDDADPAVRQRLDALSTANEPSRSSKTGR